MRKAVRVTQRRYADSAYSGAGSLRHHGRWHRAGIPVVYATESVAVALLELLVHIERPRLLTLDLVAVACSFDDALVEEIFPLHLPEDWRSFPWPASTQEIGRRWFEEAPTPVLSVPSAVVPSMRNFLLNPEHPRFREIQIASPEPLDLDPRLGT
jgi:RES domain-containing protein